MRTAEVKILEMGYTLECLTKIPELSVNDRVLVEKNKIIYLGAVSGEVKSFDTAAGAADNSAPRPDCFIIRKLFPFETGERYLRYRIEDEGFHFCRKNAEELKLVMKLLRVKYMPSENKLVFYYSAEERVDFRELVKILAARFHLRIEMRQINIRDECKILGGIGVCGRVCCCNSIVSEMNAVTSKITKLQCQNTSKFVGYCGRLLCCLAFDPPMQGENICGDEYAASDAPKEEEPFTETENWEKNNTENNTETDAVNGGTPTGAFKDGGYEK